MCVCFFLYRVRVGDAVFPNNNYQSLCLFQLFDSPWELVVYHKFVWLIFVNKNLLLLEKQSKKKTAEKIERKIKNEERNTAA